jgi:hypothetical protein
VNSDFPSSLESLNCDWLSRVLKENETLTCGCVVNFSAQEIEGGYTSSVYMLSLKYDQTTVTAPSRMIAKFHSSSASTRAIFDKFGIFEKEVRFYQCLDKNLGLPVPGCYAAEYDQKTGEFILLLEDLSAARHGSWEVDLLGDIRTALPQLAKIHAQFWNDHRLQNYEWVVKSTEADNASAFKQEWSSNLQQAKKHYHDQWSDYAWSACLKSVEFWDEIMQCMNRDTHTLVHTDPHIGQMFFPTEELPNFYLFDWQYPCKSIGAEDVVHLIVAELSAEERRQHEVVLFDLYYDSLCAAGVSDLSRERFNFQCRLCLLWLIIMNFRMITNADMLEKLKLEAEEANEDWRQWVFGQLGPVIEDWGLSEAIDQAVVEARSQ